MPKKQTLSRNLILKDGLTAAVLTKNAQETLAACLDSANFADEIIVIDQQSSDKTIDIAMKYSEQIISTSEPSFARRREKALKICKTTWILYVDSDEIVTSELAQEVRRIVDREDAGVYQVTRENYFLGKRMYPDAVERLFHVFSLRGFTGDVHESAIVTVPAKRLTYPLLHNTHRDISSMLLKTNAWSEIEAQLRINAHHPPMAWWRLWRIAVSEGWQQFGKLGLLKYGREGLFEGCFQIIDKLIVYVKLWERQLERNNANA